MMIENPGAHFRVDKINQAMKEELSFVLRKYSSDPRLQKLTITQVAYHKKEDEVRVGVCGLPERLDEPTSDEKKEEILAALKKARAFLFEKLRKRVHMRRCPFLSFYYDDSLEKAAQVWKKMGQIERTSS